MSAPLTLMAVHAHPDDESSSTGGILARYADEGVRTVVVTCTNGELGDAPGGIKPGEDGHDEAEVARIRRGELERACETLGVTHLELLGYHDSGMVDWEDKDRPDVFCNVRVDDAAERLSGLFERYEPDVVVTYDELGGYDHPDHVHAARVTMAAVEARITTTVDVSPFVERKRVALATHASQIQESFWSDLPTEAFRSLFGEESFIRAHDTVGAPIPETDLFVGLR